MSLKQYLKDYDNSEQYGFEQIKGKKIYKQDQELNDKISELYLHYRERAS